MRLTTRLRSIGMRVFASQRTQKIRQIIARSRRRLRGQPPVILYFHQVDDPYSFIMAHQLQRFAAQITIEIQPFLVSSAADDFKGDSQRYDAWAIQDAFQIAPFFGPALPTTDGASEPTAPDSNSTLAANAALAPTLDSGKFFFHAQQTGQQLWAGKMSLLTNHATQPHVDRVLEAGNALRQSLGHFQGGTVYYDGEWFWGADRLPLLYQRLTAEGYCHRDNNMFDPHAGASDTRLTVKAPVGDQITLEYFPSLRSPYSAIAHARVEALAAVSGVHLELRPVMPMLMRGVSAPRNKQQFIISDSAREARAKGIPFGNFVDPFGDPVRRGFALFPGALAQGKGMAFIGAYLNAAFAEGIDIDSEDGLRRVVANAGLSWDATNEHPDRASWPELLEDNVNAMLTAGLWGVPSFRISSPGQPVFCCWGQDRIWRVEHEIARRQHHAGK